jgi:glycosyltransferase involved in cell wall biosynthesis
MKIAYLSPFYLPSRGGIETFCKELAKSMIKRGHEVHILTQSITGFPEVEHVDGITIWRFKPVFKIFKAVFFPSALKIINNLKPDVLHIQAPAPLTGEYIVLKNQKCKCNKVIITYHNDPALTQKWTYRLVRSAYLLISPKVISANIDWFILVSNSLKNSPYVKRIPKEKIAVIHNGVDTERFSPVSQSPKRSDEIVALFVGSMEPWHAYKGVEYLILVAKLIPNIPVKFYIIGEGVLRKKYETMVASLGLTERFSFVGGVSDNDLLKYYRMCDFLVLPSVGVERCPLVVLEAAACGKPAIVTDIPGLNEIVKNEVTGLIVPPRNEKLLAEATKRMVNEEKKRLKMGEAARKTAVKEWSWDIVSRKYEEYYKKQVLIP